MRQSEYNANSLIVDTVNTRMLKSKHNTAKLNIALIKQERMTKLALTVLIVFIAYITYLVVAKLISL